MIAEEYAFHRPSALAEVLTLLDQHGDEARLLAGGMSLLPIMTLGLAQPGVVISLNHVRDDALVGVTDGGDTLRIGAMTRHAAVATDSAIARHAPLLAAAAASIGDVQIRNRGTLGGSLAHADPAADYLPVLLALDAIVHTARREESRALPAADFFTGLMSTALEAGELLVAVEIPKLGPGVGSAYRRLHRVEGNFAIVAAAAVVADDGVRLGLGGVGPAPLCLRFEAGAEEDLETIGEAAFEAAADAVDDLNGSAAYRRAMARVYAKRVVGAAATAAATP